MNKREEDIIRYVSGEMDNKEQKQFEQRLSEDDALSKEVKDFSATQEMLQQWPEEAFEIPSASIFNTNNKAKKLQVRYLITRRWVSYAAAIILLLAFAWLSDLQVSQKDKALILSFGPLDQEASYNSEQLAQVVDEAVAKYAAQSNSQASIKEDSLDQAFKELEQRMAARMVNLYQKEITGLKQNLSNHERKQLLATEELARGLQLEQRVVLQEAIIAVLDQLEQQRLEDRIDVEKAFQQITVLLAELQDGGINVASGLVDGEFRHY